MRLSGPNTDLLKCGRWLQRPRTGGPEATDPPPLEANRVVKIKPAAMDQEAIEDPAFYPRPAFFLDISPGFDLEGAQAPDAQLPGPAPPLAVTHASAYTVGEQSVTYMLDAGNLQRLHQPGFYPSPFAPSTDLDVGHSAVTVTAPHATTVPPAYYDPAVPEEMPSSACKYDVHMQTKPTVVAPMLLPPVRPSDPALATDADAHAQGPHLHYPVVPSMPLTPTHTIPNAPPLHATPMHAAGDTSPVHAQAVKPSAPNTPYPTPIPYDSHLAMNYPDPHVLPPLHATALPTYHTDQKPAV